MFFFKLISGIFIIFRHGLGVFGKLADWIGMMDCDVWIAAILYSPS